MKITICYERVVLETMEILFLITSVIILLKILKVYKFDEMDYGIWSTYKEFSDYVIIYYNHNNTCYKRSKPFFNKNHEKVIKHQISF